MSRGRYHPASPICKSQAVIALARDDRVTSRGLCITAVDPGWCRTDSHYVSTPSICRRCRDPSVQGSKPVHGPGTVAGCRRAAFLQHNTVARVAVQVQSV